MFGPRFEENMDLAVRAVRLELTLPWYMRVREFHGEAISTDPRVVDPQHLAPNDSMVFHQVLQACSESIVSRDDPIVARATYEPRDRREARSETVKTVDRLVAAGNRPGARLALVGARDTVAAVRVTQDDADLRELASLIDLYLTNLHD